MMDATLINYVYKGLRAEYNTLYKRVEENTFVKKKNSKNVWMYYKKVYLLIVD